MKKSIGFKNKKRIRNCRFYQRISVPESVVWHCCFPKSSNLVELYNNHIVHLGKFKEYSWLSKLPEFSRGIPPRCMKILRPIARNWKKPPVPLIVSWTPPFPLLGSATHCCTIQGITRFRVWQQTCQRCEESGGAGWTKHHWLNNSG